MNEEMTLISTKRVAIDNVMPGMVLSKDIVTPSGTVLIYKDTMINAQNYRRLLESDIEEIYVKEVTINAKSVPFSTQPKFEDEDEEVTSILEREEFKRFERTYEDKREETKHYLKAISDGALINLEELYKLTDDIMDSLQCKSDVFTFIGFLKSHDEYTFSHSTNVSLLCNLFASWLGLEREETMLLTAAGILHDLGKTKIPDAVLNKRGRLTDAEFEIMKSHTVLGYRILKDQDIPEEIKIATLMHHERIDGSGYPMGIKGDKISKFSKIVAICDVYDAMTADRIYRGRICPFEVIRKFETSSFSELDTEYLMVFLRNIAYTYSGSWVRLSNGAKAEIVFINQADLSKPIVRCGDALIDLTEEEELSIAAVI